MIKVKKIDISRMRVMFGKILIGEDVERFIIDNFSIPDTRDAVDIFFNEYGHEAFDEEALFHFLTFFTTFLYRIAPIKNKDFINRIAVTNTTLDNGKLLLEISYTLD